MLLARTARACIARISADSFASRLEPGTLGSWNGSCKPVRGNRPGHPSRIRWRFSTSFSPPCVKRPSEEPECSPRWESSGHGAKIGRDCERFSQDLPNPGRAIACNSRVIGLLVRFPALARERQTRDERSACSWPGEPVPGLAGLPGARCLNGLALPESSRDPHEEPRGGKSTGAGPNSQRPNPAHICCRRPG